MDAPFSSPKASNPTLPTSLPQAPSPSSKPWKATRLPSCSLPRVNAKGTRLPQSVNPLICESTTLTSILRQPRPRTPKQHTFLDRPANTPSCLLRSSPSSSASAVRHLSRPAICPPAEDEHLANSASTPGPFTVEVSQVLKLRNPNKQPVAFKVRFLLQFYPLEPSIANGPRSKPPLLSSTIPQDAPTYIYTSHEKEAHKTSRYCVRPNSGRIEPGHEVEVSGACLQADYQTWAFGLTILRLQSSSRP